MDANRYHYLITHGGSWSPKSRAIFRFHGPDAERYLSGQITQDVGATREGSKLTAITDAKGKIEGVGILRRKGDDDFYLDVPDALRDPLFLRLTKYLIADDLEADDVTEEFRITHRLGTASIDDDASPSQRLGLPGFDQITPISIPPVALEADQLPITEAEADTLRIIAGHPAWGKEIVPGRFPQECGIGDLALSFTKGCYVGQEVISRIKSAGKLNHWLTTLVGELGDLTPPPSGSLLHFPNADQEVGQITSSSLHASLDRWVAIAYVRKHRPVQGDAFLVVSGGGSGQSESSVKATCAPPEDWLKSSA